LISLLLTNHVSTGALIRNMSFLTKSSTSTPTYKLTFLIKKLFLKNHFHFYMLISKNTVKNTKNLSSPIQKYQHYSSHNFPKNHQMRTIFGIQIDADTPYRYRVPGRAQHTRGEKTDAHSHTQHGSTSRLDAFSLFVRSLLFS